MHPLTLAVNFRTDTAGLNIFMHKSSETRVNAFLWHRKRQPVPYKATHADNIRQLSLYIPISCQYLSASQFPGKGLIQTNDVMKKHGSLDASFQQFPAEVRSPFRTPAWLKTNAWILVLK